jgi:hypothetical protein
MTKALVRTQIRLQQMVTNRNREAGQGTLEYVGMVIIAGLFAAGLIAAAGHVNLKGKFDAAIAMIFT